MTLCYRLSVYTGVAVGAASRLLECQFLRRACYGAAMACCMQAHAMIRDWRVSELAITIALRVSILGLRKAASSSGPPAIDHRNIKVIGSILLYKLGQNGFLRAGRLFILQIIHHAKIEAQSDIQIVQWILTDNSL